MASKGGASNPTGGLGGMGGTGGKDKIKEYINKRIKEMAKNNFSGETDWTDYPFPERVDINDVYPPDRGPVVTPPDWGELTRREQELWEELDLNDVSDYISDIMDELSEVSEGNSNTQGVVTYPRTRRGKKF